MDASQTSQTDSKSKAETLLQQFFAKTAQIIVQSRVRLDSANSRRNKWFNLEVEDREPLREEIKFWKGQLASSLTAPPLILDILLDISQLTDDQHILITSKLGRRHRIAPEQLIGVDASGNPIKKTLLLLETWQLTLSPEMPKSHLELPSVYKRCIVFFRSLYSFVRLMPAYRLARSLSAQSLGSGVNVGKLTYRVGTARDSSPLIVRLDQLFTTTDLSVGIAESTFESIETPLGIFYLHATYRIECDFEVENAESPFTRKKEDLETDFFHHQEIARRLSAQHDAISQPSDSFYKKVDMQPAAPRFKAGSLPRSLSREGAIPILNRNVRKSFMASYSVSPDTPKIGRVPSARSMQSSPYGAFTPPVGPSYEKTSSELPLERPPFATASNMKSTDPKSYILSEYMGASPPFESSKSFEPGNSLAVTRKPSLIFPSSPITIQSTPPGPILFNSSSLGQTFAKNTRVGSYSSQDQYNTNAEVENFLMNIEQSQSRRITFGGNEVINESHLTGTKLGGSSMATKSLEKFRKLKDSNAEYVTKQLTDGRDYKPKEIPSAENDTKETLSKMTLTQNIETSELKRTLSRRRRQRSVTTDWIPHKDQPNIYDGLSRSEIQHRDSTEDDELLFNMSMMD